MITQNQDSAGYVGMPKALYLTAFAKYVYDLFNSNVYLVGSALNTKSWHDLDVITILPDNVWNNFNFGKPELRFNNKKWIAYCIMISSFGKSLLNCEVDFQIHQYSYSNKLHPNDPKLLIST